MAPATTTPCLDTHDISAFNHVAVAQRADDALIRPTRIDDAASRARRLTAGDAPRRMLDAVNAHGHRRFRRQHLKLANEPAATAPATRSTRIGVDGIARNAHGE